MIPSFIDLKHISRCIAVKRKRQLVGESTFFAGSDSGLKSRTSRRICANHN